MDFIKLHPAAKDIAGNRYGRLIALGPVFVKKFASGANHVHWLCRCDCGTEKVISIAKLSTGNTRSCGCLRREFYETCGGVPTHGQTGTPEHEVWHAMLQRCRNPKSKGYPNYGGRGISVCERWTNFEAFFCDMGLRPSAAHSIDRYPDNDGNYEPTNCRWATKSEQQRNRRNNFIVTAFGQSGPLVGFVKNEKYFNRARGRIKRGWNVELAISTPPTGAGRKPTLPESIGFWRDGR